MSIREIKNKAYEKGVYADDIEDYISQNIDVLEEYEKNSVRKLMEKKRGMEPQKLRQYLLNRGFNPENLKDFEK